MTKDLADELERLLERLDASNTYGEIARCGVAGCPYLSLLPTEILKFRPRDAAELRRQKNPPPLKASRKDGSSQKGESQ